MRAPYSAPNYDDPVEHLSPPTYYHAPLQTGQHFVPIAGSASKLTFTLEVRPNGHSLAIIVQSEGA